MAQQKSKLPMYLGVAAAGGVGYYLYQAGGNPRGAAKQAKIDVKGAEKPTVGRDTGAKIDDAVHQTEQNLTKAKEATEDYAKDRKNELLHGIDKADQKITEEAAKAKGWFGSGK